MPISKSCTCLFILLISTPAFFAFRNKDIPKHKLHFENFKSLKGIPEPSDIAYDQETGHFFIVSDHGILFETDLKGKVIRQAAETGTDFEGVEIKNGYVFVADESGRKVYKYEKKDLKLSNTYATPYNGKPNKGFESITYNYSKNCFVLISEKNPTIIFEYNDSFKITNQYHFDKASDISAARYWKGAMYLLSDEDACILRCDPITYEVKEHYKFDILNPEGFVFDDSGNLTVVSDDLERIYFFKNLPSTK